MPERRVFIPKRVQSAIFEQADLIRIEGCREAIVIQFRDRTGATVTDSGAAFYQV